MRWLSGFKTIGAAAAVALGPAALQFIGGIDPTAVFGLSPTAGAIVGVGFGLLRAVSSTAVFTQK